MKRMIELLMTGVVMAGLMPVGAAAQTARQPAASASPEVMTAAEMEAQGDNLRKQKEFPQAIQYYRAALRKQPKSAVLYNKMGMAELQTGNRKAAQNNFERASRLDPSFAEPINNLGAIFFVQKKYDKSIRYFKKALALNETKPTFHVNLGAAWFAQEQYDRASTEFARAVELDPLIFSVSSRSGVLGQVSPEERARYDFVLAKMFAKRGDIDQCLHYLKKAKEEGYNNMGSVYKDESFAKVWQDTRLAEVVPTPAR
ncbi:MAG TPA: tetratricopeptide repeat protein [Terriglobales bacterium]|nr:tetratricopeptide repeat protein [Terriglobales bacterium]